MNKEHNDYLEKVKDLMDAFKIEGDTEMELGEKLFDDFLTRLKSRVL